DVTDLAFRIRVGVVGRQDRLVVQEQDPRDPSGGTRKAKVGTHGRWTLRRGYAGEGDATTRTEEKAVLPPSILAWLSLEPITSGCHGDRFADQFRGGPKRHGGRSLQIGPSRLRTRSGAVPGWP